jgi:hypothetical protein
MRQLQLMRRLWCESAHVIIGVIIGTIATTALIDGRSQFSDV